jgi:hypothetical protein
MIASSWDSMDSWHMVLPPSRPSIGDLRAVARHLSVVPRDVPVAVMGSTPEFRSLLGRLGFERVVVVDDSLRFYQARSTEVARWPLLSEQFVCQTWQSHFGNIENQYGAILSDLTLGNVPYSERAELYEGVARSLVKGGLFVDKVLTNDCDRYSFQYLGSRFKSMPLNLAVVNDFNCRAVFCGELSGLSSGILHAEEAYDELLSRIGSDPAIRKILDWCKIITPPDMKWYYGKEWTVVERDYVKSLVKIEVRSLPKASPYSGHASQMFHRKR